MDKKWILGILTSVFVISALAAFRDNLFAMWESPRKLSKVEQVLEAQQKTQQELVDYSKKKDLKDEEQDKVTALQVESLKEQLSLVAELRKQKK